MCEWMINGSILESTTDIQTIIIIIIIIIIVIVININPKSAVGSYL